VICTGSDSQQLTIDACVKPLDPIQLMNTESVYLFTISHIADHATSSAHMAIGLSLWSGTSFEIHCLVTLAVIALDIM